MKLNDPTEGLDKNEDNKSLKFNQKVKVIKGKYRGKTGNVIHVREEGGRILVFS